MPSMCVCVWAFVCGCICGWLGGCMVAFVACGECELLRPSRSQPAGEVVIVAGRSDGAEKA